MTPDKVFEFANALAFFGWMLLLIAPGRKLIKVSVMSGAICVLFAIIYLIYVISSFDADSFESFSTLAGLMTLFSSKEAVLAGWLHYLAFDMFVGIWIVNDARRLSIKHLYTVPSLIFTFMMGPVGFLSYMILRFIIREEGRSFLLAKAPSQP